MVMPTRTNIGTVAITSAANTEPPLLTFSPKLLTNCCTPAEIVVLCESWMTIVTHTYRGQAEKWIYPKIGAKKLAEFKATDADRFLRDVAKVLTKSSLAKIKSTLVRSIRRAQKYDLIGRNVAELVDLPQGQPGHPSRAMTEEQASKVLQAASGQPADFVKVVKVSQGRYAATHAATETGELACGCGLRRDDGRAGS